MARAKKCPASVTAQLGNRQLNPLFVAPTRSSYYFPQVARVGNGKSIQRSESEYKYIAISFFLRSGVILMLAYRFQLPHPPQRHRHTSLSGYSIFQRCPYALVAY